MFKFKTKLFIIFVALMLCLTSANAQNFPQPPAYPANVTTLSQMFDWISINITYTLDNPYHWQTPATTIDRRKGMCVDIAGLALQWAHDKFGFNGYIILVSTPGDAYGHAYVKFDDLKSWFVEPQTGVVVPTQIAVIDFIISLNDYNLLLMKGETK